MLYDILIPEKALNDIAQMKCLFVVMEYISVDLKSSLEGEGGIKWGTNDIKQILYNMLCTINFIHSCNVMHRDIKPANILINDDCSIKFCDFGLSRTIIPVDANDDTTDIADL
jgi:mitogen-activated protein kinase 1/3